MTQYIQNKIPHCARCIRRKRSPTKAAKLVNITSTTHMELVSIDYLSLECSNDGYENILVIQDHFRQYAQAIPMETRQQWPQQESYMKTSSFIMGF